ncbi:YigZ family protein [Clostridium sp. 'deep sea']|uniref:IMPACT family protein n=1 Tax=Clostridium sp. 'deep sea' TaxID=2779445 RepID=UPI001896707F|nr:YigZ family protein [Clostridium sp. 'deep sea']QOR35695.1 YigZ family protein [Clostridium sp. 'deep sea']
MINTFKTIKTEVHFKNKVGLCRFYGSASPATTVEEANKFIQKIRDLYPDATHHVWAYKIGINENTILRYSDDGEPANSSGPPVSKAIEGNDLTNIAVVITRYYGGVNQGVGGLIRAYGRTASKTISETKIIENEAFQIVEVKPVEYNQLGDVIHHVEKLKGSIKNIVYDANVKIIALLKPQDIDKFKTLIRDLTRGVAEISLGEFVWQEIK